mgnify:CR=1 FL=1
MKMKKSKKTTTTTTKEGEGEGEGEGERKEDDSRSSMKSKTKPMKKSRNGMNAVSVWKICPLMSRNLLAGHVVEMVFIFIASKICKI